jgi:signal transduction histidine kinase/ligand-binding sensor domain-containing protein
MNVYAQSEEVHFNQLSTKNGLSSNKINDILHDSRGFLWFATDMGLHRWDGYEIKLFYHKPGDTSSLSSSSICSIYEDENSILWIGTYKNGLNRYHRDLENFTRYEIGNINPEANHQNIVWGICEGHGKNIWVATEYGLLKFNRATGEFKRFVADSRYFSTIISDQAMNNFRVLCRQDDKTLLLGTRNGVAQFDIIKEIFIQIPLSGYTDNIYDIRGISGEGSGIFWIASYKNGLYRYDSSTNLIKKFVPVVLNRDDVAFEGLISIYAKSPDEIWIGTRNGLFKFNQQTNTARVWFPNSRDLTSISSSIITKIYADKDNNLWFGSQDRGVNFLPNKQKPYRLYEWDSENSNSLGRGFVHSICEDSRGNIWIGSWGGGVSCFSQKNKNYIHFTTGSSKPNRINSDYINVIYCDNDDNIWIGTTGLNLWNPQKGSIHSIDELKFKEIRTICDGANGDLWIGFKYAGIALYRRSENSFKYFFHKLNDSMSLSDNHVLCMYRNKSGSLWIGTGDGLNRLNDPLSEKPAFIRYYNDPDDINSISHNQITSIYEDSKERVWIGTKNGLNLFNAEIDGFRRVRVIEGLANNTVQKIAEDNRGNLWIRWGEKLIKYNHDKGDLRVYNERDRFLPEGEYGSWNAVLYKGKSGMMYYGGVNKFITFDPDELKDNPEPPPMVITNFLLHNKPVNIGKDTPLKQSITETKLLELTHTQNIISFEFAALDYTNPLKNHYAYRLEGVNEEWIYTDATRRFANYTNLDPGEYVFRVKGTNSDGVWNEAGTSIKIIILPPWWETSWAYIAYGLLIFVALYSIRRYELNRQRLRLESVKYREIDRMKSNFFANISHEFRTPLTLIKGPIQQILTGEFTGNIKKQYQMILRNTNRLMQLINQLLDLSKLDSGEMGLKTGPEDIVSLVNGLTQSFESLAKQKNIELQFQSSEEEVVAYIDRDKFEKIIINLLSNALKFTPDGGFVSVSVNLATPQSSPGRGRNGVGDISSFLEIVITNSGEGISPDKLDRIFGRFYQVDDSSIRNYEGTGIGLSLTKELVELHHGKITVESEPGKETTFTVYLPLGKNHLQPEEIIETSAEITPELDLELVESTFTQEFETGTTTRQPVNDSSTLLIVEDNADMRNYMRESLELNYNIIEAEDGEKGIQQVLEHFPDMIISDVNGWISFLCGDQKRQAHQPHSCNIVNSQSFG